MSALVKVSDYFDVKYGVNLELNALEQSPDGIAFVSRTSKHNGVSARVKPITGLAPLPAGVITVAGGGSVMESFLQPEPFYSGRDLYVLTPKLAMTDAQKLYYCLCLRRNKFKFSYGRQANRTLGELLIPSIDDIPAWASGFDLQQYAKELLETLVFGGTQALPARSNASDGQPELVPLESLFEVENGVASSSVTRYPARPFVGEAAEETESDDFVPYIRPSKTQLTSIDAYVRCSEVDEKHVYPKHTLYVSTDGQGSHSYAYVSVSPFVPNSNVAVLVPKRPMGIQEKLYYAACVTANRFKFSYGRKPKGDRLKSLLVPSAPPAFVYEDHLGAIAEQWREIFQ